MIEDGRIYQTIVLSKPGKYSDELREKLKN